MPPQAQYKAHVDAALRTLTFFSQVEAMQDNKEYSFWSDLLNPEHRKSLRKVIMDNWDRETKELDTDSLFLGVLSWAKNELQWWDLEFFMKAFQSFDGKEKIFAALLPREKRAGMEKLLTMKNMYSVDMNERKFVTLAHAVYKAMDPSSTRDIIEDYLDTNVIPKFSSSLDGDTILQRIKQQCDTTADPEHEFQTILTKIDSVTKHRKYHENAKKQMVWEMVKTPNEFTENDLEVSNFLIEYGSPTLRLTQLAFIDLGPIGRNAVRSYYFANKRALINTSPTREGLASKEKHKEQLINVYEEYYRNKK